MESIADLPQSVDKSWVDGITNQSKETIVYITICGPWHCELVEALDCIYFDNKRKFELVTIKKDNKYVGACVAMKDKKND